MTVVRGFDVFAWVVFVGGVLVMLARLALRLRSPEQRYRTGRILAWAMLVSGPVFAVVYALGGLDVADTLFDGSGRRGPWFMAVAGAVMTALAPGALRRTGKGITEHR